MKWIIAAAVLATTVTAGPDVARAAADNVRAKVLAQIAGRCAEKWPGKYRMQKFCNRMQIEAVERVSAFSRAHPGGSPGDRIQIDCWIKWTDPQKRPNFRMIDYCTKAEWRAYRELGN